MSFVSRRAKRRGPSLGRRLKRMFWFAVATSAVISLSLPHLHHAWRTPSVRLSVFALLVLLGAAVVYKITRAVRTWRSIRRLRVSDDRAEYLIDNADYRRGSPKESAYRRTMQLTLLSTFDNRCAKCGARDDGVDLDHFFLPKNEGGCFIMRHADGYLVNNALPLCVGCNRAKSDRSYRKFFTRPELARILEKNAVMTKLLNHKSPLDRAGQPRPRIRIDRAA